MAIALYVVVGLVLAIIIARFVIRKSGESKFRKLAEELTQQVNTANKELEDVFLPTHLTTETDVDDFKVHYQSLLEGIESLENHKFYNDDIFEETGIASFKSLLSDSKSKIAENNEVYHTIEDLKSAATKVMEGYRSLVHPAHYFAYSELDSEPFLLWITGEAYNEK